MQCSKRKDVFIMKKVILPVILGLTLCASQAYGSVTITPAMLSAANERFAAYEKQRGSEEGAIEATRKAFSQVIEENKNDYNALGKLEPDLRANIKVIEQVDPGQAEEMQDELGYALTAAIIKNTTEEEAPENEEWVPESTQN